MLTVAILAGGLATRLRPITHDLPKALIEINGKPFIEHQLELLKRNGCTRVVLCVGFLGEKIESVLGDGTRMGIHVEYAYDGKTLLGTGGALRKALSILGTQFFVLYGDAYLNCDYSAVEKAFIESEKEGLMTVFRNENQWDSSNVLFKDNRIIRYDKQHPTLEMKYIDYGLGVLNAQVFEEYPKETFIDLASIYMDLIAKDELAGFEIKQRFYEIGSPSGLKEISRYLSTQEKRA